MHLQQTKRKSRDTGGPQYYFHNLTDPVKIYLRNRGVIRVALVTPYGATKTEFLAVGKDHKLDSDGAVVEGKVGHDRIQQGDAPQSIGEEIRHWYDLPNGDFERIDVQINIVDDDLYLVPTKCKQVGLKKAIPLNEIERPLTFSRDYVSRLWKNQLTHLVKNRKKSLVEWSLKEICRIVKDHKEKVPHIQEPDLLRASGPLKHLGLALGPYVGKGYDCFSEVKFMNYPSYSVPVEVKRYSKGFKYQMRKYGKDELSRAVILCAVHDLENTPANIDVIELDSVCDFIGSL